MGHKVFIPLTDELIFDRPELISAPLRPYAEDLACYHWLDIRINPDDELPGREPGGVTSSKRSFRDAYPHDIAA